jgi:hypothetical protein
MCRAGRFMHAWSAAGVHRKWPLQWWRFERKAPSYSDMVRGFYPHVGDPTGYQLVTYLLEWL